VGRIDDEAVTKGLEQVVAGLPVGEVRDGQIQMAHAVATALRTGGHVAVAAGTGTGKSLGYLVPAALSGKRVVVATATKALQDQLSSKDLPLVASGLGLGLEGKGPKGHKGQKGQKAPLRWAVLKGRANYLCRQAIAELAWRGDQERLDLAGTTADVGAGAPGSRATATRAPRTGSVGDEVARLVAWSETARNGDRAELDFEPTPAAWSSVSVTADQCPGAARCPSGAECFAEVARARAAQADVIVVNHHLLGADLRAGGVVLPEHDALVVDEAHELEDILAASLGVDLGAGRVRGIAAGARSALGGAGAPTTASRVVDEVMDAATQLETVMGQLPEARLERGLGGELNRVVTLLRSRLERLESALRSAGGEGTPPEAAQRCLRAQLAVERCREELGLCLEAGAETVVWVAGGDHPRLRSAPLDVSAPLAEQVFSKMPVVLTSATMAPGLAPRLGADRATVTEIDVGSPFDFASNGLIYCAVRLPDRRRPDAEAKLHDELRDLVLAAGGRTLALFTSRRAMERATEAIRGQVPWPVHMQGDLPKPALVDAFAREEESCLFATMGYWQGVDVPGATLSLVVIDKIPFPRPDDPLMAARRTAAGADGFRAVDLPRAATLLAQGAGRLIRTASDRGVVAILDPRLATASYSGYLVKALPKMRRTRERDEALAFLGALAGERA
jgi:ATP-dependent DNA helicase DinG